MAAVPEPGSDLELLTAVTDSLEGALALIDQRPALSAGEQLAGIAIGVLRAVAPLLRSEVDRQLADVAGGKA
jgi:hypothetical protein